MYERHPFRRIPSAFIFILIFTCLLSHITAHADEESVRTVRVAFPEQEGMSFIGRSGKITGYNYDYLQKISEYTGWKMEYIAYPDADANTAVSSALSDLMDGKVDLLGPILKNEQTEQLLEFPENSYGAVYTTLCASNTGNLRESNFMNQAMIKIGLWESAETRNQEVIHYMDSTDIPYEITMFSTAEEQFQALADGTVDAISSVSLSPVANTRIVAQFSPRPYYFAATKGNTELVQELNETIEQINQIQPHLQETLFEAYFRNSDDAFALSDEQKSILSEMHSLNVLCLDYDAPYVYQNNGQPSGLLVSILNAFAAELDLPVTYTFCHTKEEAHTLLNQDDYTILIGMPFTSSYCAENGFIQSEPVIMSALAFAQSPYTEAKDSIAIVRGLDELVDTSQYETVLLCDNATECIKAVTSGKVSAAVGDRSIMEYYIYETGSSLATSLISGETQEVCLAVSRGCPVAFATALNNYIYSISDSVKTGYLSDSNIHNIRFSPSYFVRMHPVLFTVAICLMTFLVAVTIFMSFYTRKINQKNMELRVANDAKSEFLSRMSHDIRTPMNGMIGMLNMADKSADNPEMVRSYLDKMRVASDYLLSLINDVLDMSRMEARQVELEDKSVYLHRIIQSCVDIMQNRAIEEGITLSANGLHQFYPPRVFASEQHIRQILLNLISNSIKYNQPGGTVTVSTSVQKQNSQYITCCFVVSDDGIGMSSEFQQHMFEPFSQENSGSRSNFKGTGLGLSIVKKIVDYKKGEITVDSAPGRGSTFTVTLTFRIDEKYKDEPVTLNPEPICISGMHILAAEDNDMSAEILQLLLEDAGASVTIVKDGQQLVDQFQDSRPGTYDCILTDIMMPVMDGYEATRQIRSMNRADASQIPIIALTANVFAEDMHKAISVGMNAHISKPFDIQQLTDCIRDLSCKKM